MEQRATYRSITRGEQGQVYSLVFRCDPDAPPRCDSDAP